MAYLKVEVNTSPIPASILAPAPFTWPSGGGGGGGGPVNFVIGQSSSAKVQNVNPGQLSGGPTVIGTLPIQMANDSYINLIVSLNGGEIANALPPSVYGYDIGRNTDGWRVEWAMRMNGSSPIQFGVPNPSSQIYSFEHLFDGQGPGLKTFTLEETVQGTVTFFYTPNGQPNPGPQPAPVGPQAIISNTFSGNMAVFTFNKAP